MPVSFRGTNFLSWFLIFSVRCLRVVLVCLSRFDRRHVQGGYCLIMYYYLIRLLGL
jgi:hypothetical protein